MKLTHVCDHCGLCCRHLLVEASAVDVLREPRIDCERPVPHRAVSLSILDTCWVLAGPGMPCPFLTPEHRCDIYATRPGTCVAFAAGSPKCQQLRLDHGLQRLEPQRADGDIVTEIQAAAIAAELEASD